MSELKTIRKYESGKWNIERSETNFWRTQICLLENRKKTLLLQFVVMSSAVTVILDLKQWHSINRNKIHLATSGETFSKFGWDLGSRCSLSDCTILATLGYELIFGLKSKLNFNLILNLVLDVYLNWFGFPFRNLEVLIKIFL